MAYTRTDRIERLRGLAAAYSRGAIENALMEYPVMPWIIATGPGPLPSHRESHPVFYGSFDWHSCVEMHWVLVRLLRLFPDHAAASETRRTLNDLYSEENLRAEAGFFDNPHHRGFERPYGWGWLLTLAAELHGWDDPDGQVWRKRLSPLATVIERGFIGWLPKQTYPIRTGLHSNSAFGLLRSLDYAAIRAESGDPALLEAILEATRRWFIGDTDYPAHYEPSGSDFLSAAISEAELISRLTDPDVFPEWLAAFLPGIVTQKPDALFQPAITSDTSDGQLAHLAGLNLSRAAGFLAIANALREDDPRVPALHEAARRHAEVALPQVLGGDYMTEHWLSAYATLLLTA